MSQFRCECCCHLFPVAELRDVGDSNLCRNCATFASGAPSPVKRATPLPKAKAPQKRANASQTQVKGGRPPRLPDGSLATVARAILAPDTSGWKTARCEGCYQLKRTSNLTDGRCYDCKFPMSWYAVWCHLNEAKVRKGLKLKFAEHDRNQDIGQMKVPRVRKQITTKPKWEVTGVLPEQVKTETKVGRGKNRRTVINWKQGPETRQVVGTISAHDHETAKWAAEQKWPGLVMPEITRVGDGGKLLDRNVKAMKSYLLVQFRDDESVFDLARSVKGVTDVLRYNERLTYEEVEKGHKWAEKTGNTFEYPATPAPIDEQVVEALVDAPKLITPTIEFKAGDMVRVTDGPFQGNDLKVEEVVGPPDSPKAKVKVNLMGQTCDATIPHNYLVVHRADSYIHQNGNNGKNGNNGTVESSGRQRRG